MDKFPPHLTNCSWDMFVFGRVIKIIPPWKGSMAIAMDPFTTLQVLRFCLWIGEVISPQHFERWILPLGSHQRTIGDDMSFQWHTVHSRGVSAGCENQGTAEFWKDQGRSTQRTANLSHAPFTEFSLRHGVGVTIFKQHPTDWCSSFRLAKNRNCPTSLVVSKYSMNLKWLLLNSTGFMFINPETSRHSLHIGVSKSMILPTYPRLPQPPTVRKLFPNRNCWWRGMICGVSSSGMWVTKHSYLDDHPT